ncbi:MAG TPA: peptidylprolyl isomerase [Armatimonadota bacterium]|nr:peptidylprolyl isomerase [Armatimonadota bacterium]
MKALPWKPIAIAAAVVVVVGGGATSLFLIQPWKKATRPAAGADAAKPTQPAPKLVAEVGKVPITQEAFNEAYESAVSTQKRPPSCVEVIPLKYRVLVDLVRTAALETKAKEHKIAPTEEQVTAFATDLAKAKISRRHPTPEALAAYLNEEGLTETAYIEQVAKELLEKDRKAVERQCLAEELAKVVTADVKVTAEDLPRYFTGVRIRRITAATGHTDPGKPAVTDAEAEKRIRAIYEELRGGAEFARLAREKSDHRESAAQGGLFTLPDGGRYVLYGTFGKEFDDNVFSTPVGQYTKPFKTDTGWHIVRVEDKQTELPNDLPQKREEYRKLVEQKIKQQTFDEWFGKLPETLGFTVHDPELEAFRLQEEQADYRGALAKYDEALAANDEDRAAIVHNQAVCHFSLEEYDEAERLMAEVIELADCVEVRAFYGELYLIRGEKDKAKEQLAKASDLASKLPAEDEILWHRKLAKTYEDMGETELAKGENAKVEAVKAGGAKGGSTPSPEPSVSKAAAEPTGARPKAPAAPSTRPATRRPSPPSRTPPARTTQSTAPKPKPKLPDFPSNPYAQPQQP